MKPPHVFQPRTARWLTAAAALAFCMLATLLPGCGGVDSGGTGMTAEPVPTTTSGRISGFGSVIVNGVRFDDTHATIVDGDGVLRTRADLALGMQVDVQGELQADSREGLGEGVASRIQFGQEIGGPVTSVDVAGSRLVVLGQPVNVDADTLFGGYTGGLPTVQPGHLVEVYAFYDPASGLYAATRIERKTSLSKYTLRGRITALSAPPTRNFSIGAASIDYGAVVPPPALANGQVVRVTLATTPVSGRWVATSVNGAQRVTPPEHNEAKLEGFISAYANSASFLVSGLRVNASAPGVRVRHGTLADLADGVRVEVDGEMTGGVLVARELDIKRAGQQSFELHGTVESVDAPTQSLVVRGITITWNGSTRFVPGNRNASNLTVGSRVVVKGMPSGGVAILAQEIRFEP